MSTRTEILLIALVTLVLAALSGGAGWLASGGDIAPWEAWLDPVGAVVFAGMGALAWAGWVFLALLLIFGFREIGYLLRQRKARRGSG